MTFATVHCLISYQYALYQAPALRKEARKKTLYEDSPKLLYLRDFFQEQFKDFQFPTEWSDAHTAVDVRERAKLINDLMEKLHELKAKGGGYRFPAGTAHAGDQWITFC